MPNQDYLLAVDVGLHTGLAFFSEQGQLLWYRSHHLPTPQKLKKLIAKLLRSHPRPTHLYIEGGGLLADLWINAAANLSIPCQQIQAEQWRSLLFYPRQHTSGSLAKREAGELARQVIAKTGAKKPTQLRHDTAEAILVGYYALQQLGWINT